LSKRLKYLRQRVSITGMGNTSFSDVLKSVAIIQTVFKRTLGSQLEDNVAQSDYTGHAALDASNRYFTPMNNAGDGENLPLGIDVDPLGFLAKAAGTDFVHTEDNRVYYYERLPGKATDA